MSAKAQPTWGSYVGAEVRVLASVSHPVTTPSPSCAKEDSG